MEAEWMEIPLRCSIWEYYRRVAHRVMAVSSVLVTTSVGGVYCAVRLKELNFRSSVQVSVRRSKSMQNKMQMIKTKSRHQNKQLKLIPSISLEWAQNPQQRFRNYIQFRNLFRVVNSLISQMLNKNNKKTFNKIYWAYRIKMKIYIPSTMRQKKLPQTS